MCRSAAICKAIKILFWRNLLYRCDGLYLGMFLWFFAIKNDIKKSDLTKKNLENIEIKYGSVALFYTIVIILIWLVLIYIRFF